MTAKTLEQEAREAEPIIYYEEMSCLRDDFVLGTDQDLADAKAMIESIVARNVLSAATARDKEMRQLRLLAEEQLTTLRKLKAEMLSDTRDKEIEELRARIAELEWRNGRWRLAFEGARDMILYERGPLEGESAGSDFINAVLGILDDEFSVVVPPIPLPEGE